MILKTNNALEGVNSNLKQKLEDHRGMNVTRQAAFLSWYLTFTRVQTTKDLKKLWVWWKTKIESYYSDYSIDHYIDHYINHFIN